MMLCAGEQRTRRGARSASRPYMCDVRQGERRRYALALRLHEGDVLLLRGGECYFLFSFFNMTEYYTNLMILLHAYL